MKVPCLLDQPDTSRRRDYAGNVSVALDLTGTSMREVYPSRQFHDFEHYGLESSTKQRENSRELDFRQLLSLADELAGLISTRGGGRISKRLA